MATWSKTTWKPQLCRSGTAAWIGIYVKWMCTDLESFLYYTWRLLSAEPMAIEASCQRAGWQISGRGQKNDVRPDTAIWYAICMQHRGGDMHSALGGQSARSDLTLRSRNCWLVCQHVRDIRRWRVCRRFQRTVVGIRGTWSRCVRQTDCRRFSSTRSFRRTLTAFPHRRRRPHEGPAAHVAILEINNSVLVVRTHRRAAAVRSAAAVCYKRIAVLCWDPIHYAAVSVRHRRLSRGHLEGRQDEVGHRYGILLLVTDAARRPGLNVVLCGDRLFQQYVVDACAKMEQQRLNYMYLRFNQNSLRSWRCSGEWRRSRRSSSAQFYAYSL